MFQRSIITLGLIVSVFLLPWWACAMLVFVAIVRFPSYIEGCFIAGLFDVVYAETPLFGVPGFVTFVTIALYLISTYVIVPRLRHDVFA